MATGSAGCVASATRQSRPRRARGGTSGAALLDTWGATEKGHTRSAAYLREKHGVSPWWIQAVTARYEWARGLRQEPPAETLEQGGELGRPAGGDVL